MTPEQHEEEARRLNKEVLRAMRAGDWDRSQQLDRLARRARDLAAVARAEHFLAESRVI